MSSDNYSLLIYNIERNFQELLVKCEMLELSIETLNKYQETMQNGLEIMRSNIHAMMNLVSNNGTNPQPKV